MSITMSSDNRALIDEIRRLLAAPASGSRAPSLSRLEETLTTGYARALALEAERSRLERRLGEAAAELTAGDDEQQQELALLAGRLSDAEGELSGLRGVLQTLRRRASDARRAARREREAAGTDCEPATT
jgi:chromosome segregation ATPase